MEARVIASMYNAATSGFPNTLTIHSMLMFSQYSGRQPLSIGNLLVGTLQKVGPFEVDIHSIDDATRQYFDRLGVAQVLALRIHPRSFFKVGPVI